MPKIYHYTKLETAIEFILPSMTLRTNSLCKMNDPKENQKWHFGGINIDYAGMFPETYSEETHVEHQYKFGEEIKSHIQALCFVHSDKHSGFENEMMWAQYADNHKGVCLELDLDTFIKENEEMEFFRFENVNYGSIEKVSFYWDRSLSRQQNINRFIIQHHKPLFLSKSFYWENEFEKRLLILANDFCYLKINRSLRGVYYGLTNKHYYNVAIEQFLSSAQTNIYKVF